VTAVLAGASPNGVLEHCTTVAPRLTSMTCPRRAGWPGVAMRNPLAEDGAVRV